MTKKKGFRIAVIVLLTITALGSTFLGFAFWRVSSVMEQTMQEIAQQTAEAPDGVELSSENKLVKFYEYLYSQMADYGDIQESGEQSAALATAVYEKTLKYCTIKNIVYQEDGMLLEIEGVFAPLDDFSTGLVLQAAGQAVFSYMGSNFLDAAASLFQGQEGVKRLIYAGFANAFLEKLTDKVNDLQIEPNQLTLKVTFDENGNASIEPYSQSPSDSSSQNENSTDSDTEQNAEQSAGANDDFSTSNDEWKPVS